MSDELDYKRVMKKSYSRLKDDMDPEPILDQFIQNDFLPPSTIRDIQVLRSLTEKNLEIIDQVRLKGKQAYLNFKNILRNSHQGDLADYLEETEKKVMENQERKSNYISVMRKSISRLEEDMDPEPILDQFLQNGFLPPETIKDIEELRSLKERNHDIIYSVLPNGIQGYLNFKDILRKSGQGDLADYLDKIEKEIEEDKKTETIIYQRDPHGDEPSNQTVPQQNTIQQPSGGLCTKSGNDGDSVDESVPKTDRIDDGRIQIEDVAWIEGQIKSNADILAPGSTGNVYLLKDDDRWRRKVVVKKIERNENSNPIINETVAARIRHHAIVPLLARCNSDTHSFFVFPYMEKGELMTAIANDQTRIQEGSKVQMNATKRVSILYKIACAMLYIHTPVDRLRNKFVHGDITSRNIVLDGNDNPRLLDFGIARELILGKDTVTVKSGDMIGTHGYMTKSSLTQLSTETDCRNFGVLIKEMLTGSKPIYDENRQLLTEVIDPRKPRFAACYEKVWKDKERVYNTLKKMAEDCLDKKVKVNASQITQDLYDILRDINQESKTEALGDKKCSLCMLNRIDPDNANLYLQNCLDNSPHEAPPVCVACMRNSYLNPIQCMRCRQTIPTKIGYSWAAILITGYDEDEKYREGINKDVKEMKKILTSKHPLVTGLSEENVIITTLHGLSKAIHKLEECTTLFTVIVYYSGHHNANSGFQNDYFSMTNFECCLKAIKKEIILIMDCCFGPDLISSIPNIKLQLNASRPDERAEFTREGSTFTQVFVETLQRRSTDSCHKAKPAFISVVLLFEQIKKDMKLKQLGCGSTPTMNLTVTGFSDLFIGYTHNTTSIKFFYEDKDNLYFEVDILDTIKDLKAELLKEVLKDRYKEQFLENHGDTLTTYSDIIAITIRKGPHEVGIHELSSIEEVTRAWNQKFELSFGIRNVKNIHNNTKVGIFLDQIKTHDILQRYLMSIGEVIHKNTNETIVKVQWIQKIETMDKLYDLKTVEHTEDAAHQWLCYTLDDIYTNPKIKEATHVVFTVPSGLWKKRRERLSYHRAGRFST